MALPLRILLALPMLALAGFCIFGVLATFEPPGWVTLRIVHICCAAILVAGSIAVLARRRSG